MIEFQTRFAQKLKFFLKDFFSKYKDFRELSSLNILGKYDQIWSHLLKKYLIENFSFCALISAD